MNTYNFIDSMVFVILTGFTLYSMDAVDFKKILKSNRPRQAFLFYILISLSISALVYMFYFYFKSLMIGF